ncbi:MAG: HAMP domain-containing protein [Anaerolineae bacterium]|nr:HAMP domain-containing protein [Anaerolineae bacterium]
MSRLLLFKLVLAFLLVSITGAVLSVVFARLGTLKEFDQLVLDRSQRDFMRYVVAYYQTYGSWEGIQEMLQNTPPDNGEDQRDPSRKIPDGNNLSGDITEKPIPHADTFPGHPFLIQPQSQMVSFALVDSEGQVVVPAGPYHVGEYVAVSKVEQSGQWIEVNGSIVGGILPAGISPVLNAQEERYLKRVTEASLYGALGATAVALIIGTLLARTLTNPLRELTQAIHAMAKGELGQQVPVRSQDELGELAQAFNQMSADLSRSNSLRRQMTADIAHDLRSPLAIIAGYLESLRDGVLKPSPARFEMMYNESQHLQRLVEDLRTLSLAEAGELSVNVQQVAPGALLEQLYEAYHHSAAQKEITLRIDMEPELPLICVDPDRILQVLGNLISNALRYTPAGGTITLAAVHQDGTIKMSVSDTGTGIPQEDLPNVFERFYRGDRSRQSQEGESGLGLTIARSIVVLHGGDISVDSVLGEGTTFTVTLDAVRDLL